MTGFLLHPIHTYSIPLSRIEQRKMLNCVTLPRNTHNICGLNTPSCFDNEYLMKWIENNPPMLDIEVIPLVLEKYPLFSINPVSREYNCLIDYKGIDSADIITAWAWGIEWKRVGKEPKKPTPVLKKIVSFEYGGARVKYDTLISKQRTRRLIVPLV